MRPHVTRGLGELEAMAHAAWSDASGLAAIAAELSRRGTGPAGELRRRIVGRMADLAPADGREAEDVVALLLAVETLRARLAAAQKEVEVQRFLIDELKAQIAAGERPEPEDLYARVHAREGIPDFALRALRAAYRRAWHPDARPPAEREAARAAFVEHEAVFQAIEALRARRGAA